MNYLLPSYREFLKSAEFKIPDFISAPIYKYYLPAKNPYNLENHALKCIFIHIPKTAGTSISSALFTQSPRHIPLVRYRSYNPELFKKYFKFCVVRNPYDRLFSAYNYLKRKIGKTGKPAEIWVTNHMTGVDSFEAFVQKLGRNPFYRFSVLSFSHFRPQFQWVILPFEKKLGVDLVARFERINEDYFEVIHTLGIERDLPKLRVINSNHVNFEDFYSLKMKSIVKEIYQADFKIFNYDFGM